MIDDEKFQLQVKLLTKFEKEIDLHKGVVYVIKERSIYDAACKTIEIFANKLLNIKNKPKQIVIEVSGSGKGVESYCLQGTIKYENFKWEKIYEGFPMLNKSGEMPFSIEKLTTVKPTIFESDLVQYLNEAFPNLAFKYKKEDIYTQINGKSIAIIDYFSKNDIKNNDTPDNMQNRKVYDGSMGEDFIITEFYMDLINNSIKRVFEELLIPNGINEKPLKFVSFDQVFKDIGRYGNPFKH